MKTPEVISECRSRSNPSVQPGVAPKQKYKGKKKRNGRRGGEKKKEKEKGEAERKKRVGGGGAGEEKKEKKERKKGRRKNRLLISFYSGFINLNELHGYKCTIGQMLP